MALSTRSVAEARVFNELSPPRILECSIFEARRIFIPVGICHSETGKQVEVEKFSIS